jgi:hypothetical protein
MAGLGMNLTMKAFSEGMRSILFYIGLMEDMAKVSETESEKAKYQGENGCYSFFRYSCYGYVRSWFWKQVIQIMI